MWKVLKGTDLKIQATSTVANASATFVKMLPTLSVFRCVRRRTREFHNVVIAKEEVKGVGDW